MVVDDGVRVVSFVERHVRSAVRVHIGGVCPTNEHPGAGVVVHVDRHHHFAYRAVPVIPLTVRRDDAVLVVASSNVRERRFVKTLGCPR